MSTVKANDLTNTTGGIPTVKGQRLIPTAWVNFNGQGTISIIDSENVSSITDTAVGKTTITYATALANTNYAVFCTVDPNVTNSGNTDYAVSKTTASCIVRHFEVGSLRDSDYYQAIVMGGQS